MDEQLTGKELARVEEIVQSNLPDALKNGLITEAEVQAIWRKTEYLSAQTPIEVRVAIIRMLQAGYKVKPAEQMMLSAVLDLRAAMTKDESKFAHLVAGTEAIVDKLKAINRWEALVEQLSSKIDEMMLVVNNLVGERQAQKGIVPSEDDPDYEFDGKMYAEPIGADPIVEEEYDRKIGSNWDPKNPRKK